jgi:hypothetical protein
MTAVDGNLRARKQEGTVRAAATQTRDHRAIHLFPGISKGNQKGKAFY